ncbi:MAG: PhoH family protein [Chitinophagaceae bacterium]|nr:PhoH family protein [Chitinophagaceae bacterium]
MAKKSKKGMRIVNKESHDDELMFIKSKKSRLRKTEAATETAKANVRNMNVAPRTQNQAEFLELLQTKTITVGSGCAGTGKTYLAAYVAAKMLSEGTVDNIIISRSMVTVGKEIGHLPGNEVEKMAPYVAPLIESLGEFLGRGEVEKLMKANIIRVLPLALMRGYTFKNSFVILDETQNTTPHEMKTVLTRIGEGSKIAVLGDIEQSDVQRRNFYSGLEDLMDRLDTFYDMNPNADLDIDFVEFEEEDIQRSEIVRQIVNLYHTTEPEDESE